MSRIWLFLPLFLSIVAATQDWSSLILQVDNSTHRTLADIHGKPFFWQADTAWETFHRLNISEVEYYMRGRAGKGFNVIYGILLAENGGLTVPNTNGDLPFIDYDLTKPNEPYFAYCDAVINMAWQYGIRPENATGALNVIDKGPIWNKLAYSMRDAEIDVLRSHKIFIPPFMTYHGLNVWLFNRPGGTASATFGNETWLTMDGVQTGHVVDTSTEPEDYCYLYQWRAISNQDAVKVMYDTTPVRPAINLENHYEYWNSSISMNEDGTYRYNASFFLRYFVEEDLGIDRVPDQDLLTTDQGLYEEIMVIRDRSWTWATVYSPMGRTFGLDTRDFTSDTQLQASCGARVERYFHPPAGGSVDDHWALLLKVAM
ncbi:uncharacterized protein PAC_05795 [Phialocephala subalpina]|uniref:Apiosidase-like catalytic domain-containing protein n=1 Tax=Phialocephala subalpina TaxID=576137 RepID=A0A1L7WT24_9HELO|nr:uncharacterized protein PAC_05795 [Phialocephala subalpina]